MACGDDGGGGDVEPAATTEAASTGDPVTETSGDMPTGATSSMPTTDGTNTTDDPAATSGGPVECGDDEWSCDFGCCVWGTEVVDAQGNPGIESWLAIADDGEIHIAYRVELRDDDFFAGSRRAVGHAGEWTTTEVGFVSDRGGYGVRIALRDGEPWVSEVRGTAYVAGTDDPVVWSPTGEPTTLAQNAEFRESFARTHLAVDGAGALRVCYPTDGFGVVCARSSGGGFQETTSFDPPEDHYSAAAISATHQAFALDADDRWHGVYLAAIHELGYLVPIPGLFYVVEGNAPERVDDIGDFELDAESPAIVVDADGTPHVAFVDQTHYEGVVTYSTRAGGQWSHEPLTSDGGPPSIAIRPDGRIAIAYYDRTSTHLQLATRDDGEWTIETVDDRPRAGVNPSLAFDAAGHPHLSYYDETQRVLTYATWVESDG